MRIAVYGSLRKGEYNYCFNDGWFVKNMKVYGYNLYNLGSYPAIYPTTHKGATIFCEVYDIPSKTFEGIRNMELGAGYVEEEIVEDGKESIKIYVYRNKPCSEIVKSGDWSDR